MIKPRFTQYDVEGLDASKFHNDIFKIPDEFMSSLTTKDILGKWMNYLMLNIQRAVGNYYFSYCGKDKEFVKGVFDYTQNKIDSILPILEDMIALNLRGGISEICEYIYPSDSDEEYLAKTFNELYSNIKNWDEATMWDECANDERLKNMFIND